MAPTTVKIPQKAHAALVGMAAEQKRPLSELLADLIEQERRRAFLVASNEAFARLRADPEEWADYQAEHRGTEGTLMDGLEDDPWIE